MARVKVFAADPNTGSVPIAADVMYLDSVSAHNTNEKGTYRILLLTNDRGEQVEVELTIDEVMKLNWGML